MMQMRSGILRALALLLVAGSALFLVKLGPTLAQNEVQPTTETGFGLTTTTFETPKGKVQVKMPDDAAAGDTLSGTVTAEATGKSDKEKAKNQDELNGYVVEVQNQKTPVAKKVVQWAAPAAPGVAYLILRDRGGKEVSRAGIPIAPAQPPADDMAEIHLPNVGQAGRAVKIWGPFDGNSNTTSVTINGNQEAVLAESPRKAVVEMPTDAEGPVAIHVRKGAAEATGVVRSIAVKLSAPRLNLRPGEVTTMTAEVRGLSGLTTDIPLSLTNRSDAVVGLEGGEQQRLLIHPEDAGPGGIYTTTRTLTGRAVGAYNLTAVVSEPKPVFLYHGALLDHDFNPLDNVPPDIKRRFYAEVDNPPANPPIFADDEGLPLPPPSKVKLGGDKKPDEGKAPEGGKPPEREMTAYMRDCVDAEVPLPPPWGKNGDGGWKKQPNDLPPDKTLVKLGAQTSVEVWIYESEKPPGICYALPRKDSTGKIIAMGVICQGKSGSACFWDNKGADGSTPIPVEPGLDPSKMADGRNLKEQCVNCHRGDNAFVITPGTPLVAKPDDKDQPTDLPPGKRPYKPIDGPKDAPREGWTNDKGDLKLSISGCTSCHAVPKLTVPYCRIMNKMFVTERSMPPAGDYSDDEAADVNNDLQQIIAACKKIPPPPGYQWQPDPYKWTPPPPPPK